MPQHQITKERWQKFTLAERLANIGSEAHRATTLSQKGDIKAGTRSAERVLELIDLSLAVEQKSSHLKELTRLREIFSDTFWGKGQYGVSPSMFNNYFLPFIFLSRR